VTKREDAARRRAERERQVGLEDDEAARWLEQHDPRPKPPESKARFKSKELHRWRQKQQRGG
jgi:hypothetical protein